MLGFPPWPGFGQLSTPLGNDDLVPSIELIAGLTQREVAAETGITPQAVTLFEKGKPTPETLAQLVAVLGPGLME